MRLNQPENLTERTDRAAFWAVRHEFRLRRAWWRRVRYNPVLNGILAFSEAMKDLTRVVSR